MKQKEENQIGLNQYNRRFITGLVFILLLLFGPRSQHSVYLFYVYLLAVPIIVWLLLRYWGAMWKITYHDNDRIFRVLVGTIAGGLLVGSYLSFTATKHLECTQYSNSRDDAECVGDYVVAKGPDKSGGMIEIMFAGFAFWLALSKRDSKEE